LKTALAQAQTKACKRTFNYKEFQNIFFQPFKKHPTRKPKPPMIVKLNNSNGSQAQ
jgi:hypothetical protein